MKPAANGWLRARQRLAVALAAIVPLLALPTASHASFQIGLQDVGFDQPSHQPYARRADRTMTIVHGNTVRIEVVWANIAPATPGSGFNPANPADPGYHWRSLDEAVRSAARHHLRIMLNPLVAPSWAEGPGRPTDSVSQKNISPGAWDPDPSDFGAFMSAVAARYSGTFPDPNHAGASLPRVSYWEIWNEENLPIYLAAPDLVGEYRALLHAGYRAVKAVHPDNVVIVGGLAPVSYLPPLTVSPLAFGAQLLCLQRVGQSFQPAASCPQPAEFDVFSYHPYSLAATPTKHANNYDDVLVGDVGKIATLVHTADRLHTTAPTGRHAIWVTEFGWFTNPPNTVVGDRNAVAARYVAYSLYEMAHADVGLVIWQTISDQRDLGILGGGLYNYSGRPKLMLRALAFPFVAGNHGSRGFAWGRAPVGGGRSVIIELRIGRHWARVALVHTAADGEFSARFRASGNGFYRARVRGGPHSLIYNSAPIPPRQTHTFYSG